MGRSASILCPNDWKFRQLFICVVIAQVCTIVLSLINSGILPLLLLKIVVGFLYTAIVPGALILRILRSHSLGSSRTFIFTVTLSLAFDMFIGLAANGLLPLFGISRPLAAFPLVIVFGIVTILLLVLAYLRDRNYGFSLCLQPNLSLIPQTLFFLLLPLLAALGAELINRQANNTLLMVLLPLIAIVPLLALLKKIIPEELYPLAIFSVAISVMLHVTLISRYIFGHDVLLEYRMFQVTEAQALWTSNYPSHGYNGVASVTILPAVLSLFSGLSGLMILKVAIPVLFCLTPLVTYEILRQYIHRKIALLTSFLPVFLYQFAIVMPQTAKNEMGWLFISAVFLALLTQRRTTESWTMALVYVLAGVMSHYYSAYLASYLLVVAVVSLFIMSRAKNINLVNFAMISVMFTFTWYMLVNSGLNFKIFAFLVNDFVNAFRAGFTSPSGAFAFNLLSRQELSFARLVLKYQYVMLQGFIVLGFGVYFISWLRQKSGEFSGEFMSFSFAAIVLFLAIILPGVAAYIDINRSFSLTMTFLVVFATLGIFFATSLSNKILANLTKKPVSNKVGKMSDGFITGLTEPARGMRTLGLVFLAIFAGSFLLFGTGWVSEVEKDDFPLSWSLSRERIHFPVFYKAELDGSEWLIVHRYGGKITYFDFDGEISFLSYMPIEEIDSNNGRRFSIGQEETPRSPGEEPLWVTLSLEPNSYIYLRGINLSSQELAVSVSMTTTLRVASIRPLKDMPDFDTAISSAHIIFDNGLSQVRLMK